MTTIDNSQKIETELTEVMIASKPNKITIKKKIETNIQKQSISQLDEMNTATEIEPMNAQATAFVAEAKKQRKPRTKKEIVVEEDPVDTIPEPIVPTLPNKAHSFSNKGGKKAMMTAEPADPDAEEEVEAEEEEDEEVLQARAVLEKAERKKLEKDIRANITEHRKTSCDQIEKQRQEILAKIQALNAENSALQSKFVDTHEGKLDDEIIAIQLVKNKKTKGKREIKLPEYVRPPNYASQYIPADTILVSKLGGAEMKVKYDGNKFINEDCGTEYETLRKATIAFTLAMNKKSIPDAWTFWKTEDGKKINRLDLNPL